MIILTTQDYYDDPFQTTLSIFINCFFSDSLFPIEKFASVTSLSVLKNVINKVIRAENFRMRYPNLDYLI